MGDGMNISKVMECNLEYGRPTVEDALRQMRDALMTCRGRGGKAVILIHGYGSSGVGGEIKTAVRKSLAENSMRGLVRAFAGGEQWHYRKKEMTGMCKSLGDHERRIANNEGVTVVILR
ncbi:MAG: Smr/MutS family protein [Clostridia bacterium]